MSNKLSVKWEPSESGGTEHFDSEDLGCGTMEEFFALDPDTQRDRVNEAMGAIPERVYAYAVSWK